METPEVKAAMRGYMVTVGNRLQFEAMAPDSCSVVSQHMELCGPHEKISVMSLEAHRAKQRMERDVVREQSRELYRTPGNGYLHN